MILRQIHKAVFRSLFVLLLIGDFSLRSSAFEPAPPPESPIANELQFSERIISGGEPTTRAHFEHLSTQGVTTIISVDGVAPKVELARNAKLRYVHIPFGYDSIPQSAALSIARVVLETRGKIFIHCHHGKHRGPAAAAIACMTEGSADVNRAKEILQLAGTSKDYSGLWKDVASFKPPPPNVALPSLHEVAPLKPLTTSMAELGREFDAVKKAAQQDKLRHAVLIHEILKESFRSSKSEESASYLKLTKQSLSAAFALRNALTSGETETNHLIEALSKTCVACHKAHRN